MKTLLIALMLACSFQAQSQKLGLHINGMDSVLDVSLITNSSGYEFFFVDSAKFGKPKPSEFTLVINKKKGNTNFYNGLSYCKRDLFFVTGFIKKLKKGDEVVFMNIGYDTETKKGKHSNQSFRFVVK